MPVFLQKFPGERSNNAAFFLVDGIDPEELVGRLKVRYADLPLVFRSNETLRREVLAIFDQTFAVTRTLQLLALLRSLGAGRVQVFRLFLGEGLAMGILGLIMGLGGGVGLAALLILVVNRTWFGWTINPAIPLVDLVVQVFFILTASVLAAVYPASQATLSEPRQLVRDDL